LKPRLAGQAFPNGVLIKSKKNWALATDDGDIRFGSSTSWLDHHPALDIIFFRSVIGFIESIVFSFRIQKETGRDQGRELLRPLVLYLVITLPIALLVDRPGSAPSLTTHIGLQIVSFVVAFAVFARALPSTIWSYHGAEHKAVHAHELDVDLDDLGAVAACSRVHNRCGTNLVTFLAVGSMLRVPSGPPLISMAGTVGYTLLTIGVCIELFRLIVRAPESAVSRVLLAPGRFLQRRLTTREPDRDQLAIAAKAVLTVLELDGMKDHS